MKASNWLGRGRRYALQYMVSCGTGTRLNAEVSWGLYRLLHPAVRCFRGGAMIEIMPVIITHPIFAKRDLLLLVKVVNCETLSS